MTKPDNSNMQQESGVFFSHCLCGTLQDNVALIAVLEALDPPVSEGFATPRRQLICVANTHIHANPELNDVKLWQVAPSSLTTV